MKRSRMTRIARSASRDRDGGTCQHGRFRWSKALRVGAGCALLILGGVYLVVSLWIGSDVRSITAVAMQAHSGDAVEALIAFVDEPSHSLKERNSAVWALGQLGDSRALPVLERYHTGEPCDHANGLCQQELEKAIQLAGGGVNVTAMVWRGDSL